MNPINSVAPQFGRITFHYKPEGNIGNGDFAKTSNDNMAFTDLSLDYIIQEDIPLLRQQSWMNRLHKDEIVLSRDADAEVATLDTDSATECALFEYIQSRGMIQVIKEFSSN